MLRSFSIVCGLFLAGVVTATTVAGEFRLYSANKLLQQRQVKPLTNMERPGCHDFIFKRRIYRVAQIEFEYCILYAKKECKPGSEVPVRWKESDKQTIEFKPGARWYLRGEDKRGIKIGSWYCAAKKQE